MELTERLEETLGSSCGSGDPLPVQFVDLFSRSNQLDGGRRLLIAVLDDAVQCYLKNMTAWNRRHRLIFNETRYWIISDSRKGLFAYENLCKTLGIEANALRAALERRRREAEEACARPGRLGAYERCQAELDLANSVGLLGPVSPEHLAMLGGIRAACASVNYSFLFIRAESRKAPEGQQA
jgi:hypothetical protein